MTIEKLYEDITKHLLEDEKPSEYLNNLITEPLFGQHPFDMLLKLQKTEQSPVHHPEGNAWNHTMLVVDEAAKVKAKSQNPSVFMWAALLHDIGKPDTTKLKKGRITSYDHDIVGEMLSKQFLSVFSDDEHFVHNVSKLVRFHMHILFVNKNLPFADIEGLKNDTNVDEVALLGYCDKMGRTSSNSYKVTEDIDRFLSNVKSR